MLRRTLENATRPSFSFQSVSRRSFKLKSEHQTPWFGLVKESLLGPPQVAGVNFPEMEAFFDQQF
jgi:hypothetical protein